MKRLEQSIFDITSDEQFNELALEVFRYQADKCLIYQNYLNFIHKDPKTIRHYTEIPFLPIEFFKTQKIISADKTPEIVFSSSGTTGMVTSKHPVADVSLYKKSYNEAFHLFYGGPKDMAILALLPSYLERESSSLIYMVDDLIRHSDIDESGYFLYNHGELYQILCLLKERHQKTILFGVTYALLDFIEAYHIEFPELIVMETGGMKGKRKEMIREELHLLLKNGFGVSAIHSEYGMTELLSQAYSSGKGRFHTPPWMKILIRESNDPFTLLDQNKTGAINVIDLANLYSCSFIATQDLGKVYFDDSFEILGRFDNSDIRGCNLLVQ